MMAVVNFSVPVNGSVTPDGNQAHHVLGNDDVLSFYIDLIDDATVEAPYTSDRDCPGVVLFDPKCSTAAAPALRTELEFYQYPGWVVHSCSRMGGKLLAITLVRVDAVIEHKDSPDPQLNLF
jgi:hypothetical protein